MTRSNKGSVPIILIVAIVTVCVVGFAGYRVMHRDDAESNRSSTQEVTTKSVPQEFKNTADINQAEQALDSDGSDTSLNPNTVDGDIRTLL